MQIDSSFYANLPANLDMRPWHMRWSRETYIGLALFGVIILTWVASFGIGFELALTILTIVGFGCAVAGFRWPFVGLLGVGMVCVMDPLTRVYLLNTGGLLRWNTLNYLLLIAICLRIPFLMRLNDLNTRLYELLVLLMAMYLLVSNDMTGGILDLLNVVSMLGLIVYFARAGHDNQSWYWLGLIAGLLAALGGLSFFVLRDSLKEINANAAAYFWNTAIFAICMGLPFARGRIHIQLLLVGLGLVNVMWVFLNASRGGLLVALACLIYMYLVLRNAKVLLFTLLAMFIFGIVAVTYFSEDLEFTIHRIEKSFDDRYSARGRSSGRSDLALGGWYIFQDNPLGVGSGSYPKAWASLDLREGLSDYRRHRPSPAHSAWVLVLAEHGVPGITLMVVYIGSFTLVGLLKRDRDLALLGILTSLCISLAFLATEFKAKGVWFLIAGVTVLLHREAILSHLQEAARRVPMLNIIRGETERYDHKT